MDETLEAYSDPSTVALMAEETAQIQQTTEVLKELQQAGTLAEVRTIIRTAKSKEWNGLGNRQGAEKTQVSLETNVILQIIDEIEEYIPEFADYIEQYLPEIPNTDATLMAINKLAGVEEEDAENRDAVLTEIRFWRDTLKGQVGGIIKFKSTAPTLFNNFKPHTLDKTELLYIIATPIENAIATARTNSVPAFTSDGEDDSLSEETTEWSEETTL